MIGGMKRAPTLWRLALLASLSIGLPQVVHAFSAAYDQDVTTQGQVMSSKVLIKEGYFKIETVVEGIHAIVIKNAKGTFQYLPDQGIVMPMPAVGPTSQIIDHPDDYLGYLREQNAKRLRTETVRGYVCDVYVYDDPKSRSEVTAWVAKRLQFPVRIQMKGGESPMQVDLKNIVLGAGIEDSAFELPAGAQTMSMDKLMQGVSGLLEKRGQ